MKQGLLHPLERSFVEEARANTSDKLAYMKLSVLVMLDEGLSQEAISILLGISSGTVHNCKKKYEQEGLEKFLDRHYAPYQGKLSDEQLAVLEEEVSNGLYSTCTQVARWIENRFEVVYSESGVRAILGKLGFVYKKTMAVPGGANVEAQEAFLKEMEPFLTEIDQEKEEVYYIDAVHPQHNTRSDYAWIKRGDEKEIRSNSGRRRININGAMNAHRPEEVEIVEAETINAASTKALLQKLLDKHPGKDIYVFADNARYYQNADIQQWLVQNPRIQLLHLPPYSPNLNLIERLWKMLRKKIINLYHYPTYEAFRKAVLGFFDNLEQHKNELRTLMRPNFQRFSACPKTQTVIA
jgi:transposase